LLDIRHADDHCASGIERKVDEIPSPIENANRIVDRVRDDAKTPHAFGSFERGPQSELDQRIRQSLSLPRAVHGQLPKQRDRDRVRLIPLMRLRQKGALELSRAERYVADDPASASGRYDVDAACATLVIVPRVSGEPCVHSRAAAVEGVAIVGCGERTRRRDSPRFYGFQPGLRCMRAFSLGSTSAGRAAHASKASHDSAGIVTVDRFRTSISAASTAARRTKSLTEVRLWLAAASSNSRSAGLIRTLRMDVAARALLIRMTLAYTLLPLKRP
jgi:hypothetical protein